MNAYGSRRTRVIPSKFVSVNTDGVNKFIRFHIALYKLLFVRRKDLMIIPDLMVPYLSSVWFSNWTADVNFEALSESRFTNNVACTSKIGVEKSIALVLGPVMRSGAAAKSQFWNKEW